MPIVTSKAAGGGSIPSGVGSPVGSVTPTTIGGLYVDTTNGGLYLAVGATSTDWVAVAGAIPAGTVAGVQQPSAGNTLRVIGPAGNNHGVTISDALGVANSGNGLYWIPGVADGGQSLYMALGAGGSLEHFWASDGTYAPARGVIFPTSDPHVAGAWWDNAGTLTKSAG